MMQLQSNRRPLSLHLEADIIGGGRGGEEEETKEEEKEVEAKWNWAEMDERHSEEEVRRVRRRKRRLVSTRGIGD